MLSHAQAPTIAKPSETTTTPITTCLLNLGTADLKSACYFAGHKMTNITLNAVSCTSTDNCEAVGDNYDSDYHMFAESWNGTAWRLQTTPNVPGGAPVSISCPTVHFCEAVGSGDVA